MSNGDDCAIGEISPYGVLKNGVGGVIHGSRGFVEDEDSTSLQKSSAEAKELSLSHAPICSFLNNYTNTTFSLYCFWVNITEFSLYLFLFLFPYLGSQGLVVSVEWPLLTDTSQEPFGT